tara:strand:- start:655 stop:1041 length:387 start_codon:yes stop_codon:yes gene_type:complete
LTTKPETNFGREIMKNLSHVFWTRIENRHGGGIPDLYGIKSWKKSAWLELKCIKQNSINLSPLQISWNYKHFRQGFNNYYIVRNTRSKVTKIYHGDKGRELAEKGFSLPPEYEFDPPIDWWLFDYVIF